ncbi:MAG TPA: transposase [Lacunisphaera sp.]|nr:transposase [Lacunisphaera sp.]
MHRRDHLRRLPSVWTRHPVYFITICSAGRRRILTAPALAAVLIESWQAAASVHGWWIGRYVIMPDHVHFFARHTDCEKTLSQFVRDWKKWTTRQIHAAGIGEPCVWQAEFFDHVLRSADSDEQKWLYVRENPVRAGLALSPEAWPWAGEIAALVFRPE